VSRARLAPSPQGVVVNAWLHPAPFPSSRGTLFHLPKGGVITTLVNFTGANGASPIASLIEDTSGNLFGIAQEGGPSPYGTAFELPKGGDPITLATFGGPIPEPAAWSMMLVGFGGIGASIRTTRRKAAVEA
jgi:PEP-CTERM motif